MAARPRPTPYSPSAYAPALGSTFISHLTDAEKFPALVIGADRWSRHELAQRIGVTNTVAAGVLSKLCKALAVKSVEHLYQSTTPYTFANPEFRAGVTTLYVMFCVFRAKGLSVEHWYVKGKSESQTLVSFVTFKKREADAEARTRKNGHRR